jgi:methylated-DNA-[protein]-cysteine S-methyltransferase
MKYFSEYISPIGKLLLTGTEKYLTGVWLLGEKHSEEPDISYVRNDSRFDEVRQQLIRYFAGKLELFDVEIELEGTDFQKRVWQALTEIPYGVTWSYARLARHIGNPRAVRAVGAANGQNPISIIIPCHRVIGATGTLVGYGGGVERKEFLLRLEKIIF